MCAVADVCLGLIFPIFGASLLSTHSQRFVLSVCSLLPDAEAMEASRESKGTKLYSRTSLRTNMESTLRKVKTEETAGLLNAQGIATPASVTRSSALDDLVGSHGEARDHVLQHMNRTSQVTLINSQLAVWLAERGALKEYWDLCDGEAEKAAAR